MSTLHLVGSGAVARAVVDGWLRRAQPEVQELRWSVSPACLRAWLRRAPLARRTDEGLDFGGQLLRVTETEREDDIDLATDDGTGIDARGAATSLIHAGKRTPIPAAAVLAGAAVLAPLEAGPGLRWVTVEIVEGRREGADPGLGAGDRPEARERLSSALNRRMPGLAGKLVVAVTTSPQLGDSLQIHAQLAPGTGLDVRDLLTMDRDDMLEAAPGARSDEALGCPRVLVDDAAILRVGPMLRMLAHYDPAAITAAAVWRQLS
ncbi:MAG: hypothetical protein KC431_01065 [Myxococcales bacterium]|nr:hypothetical protein [Myxococcales bacterium]